MILRALDARAGNATFALMCGIALALSLLSLPVPAKAQDAEPNPRYASIVVNARTGDVLYARNADAMRYPASLTKLMTLYLLFEAIESGEVGLKDEITASARASGQPPSKLGLEPGDKITVEHAIRALVVRSANDVATAVAEHLGGTEFTFAQAMTQRARELGMTRTRFANASGLPNRNQQSTARDMATLSIAMVRDFPQYAHYFNEQSVTWNGRTWRSHNRLIGSFEGAEGLKTGYTRASGFNLSSSVKREEAHLIGIVLGGRTAARRDADMRRIINLTFSRLKENPLFGSTLVNVRPTPRPDGGTVQLAAADTADNAGKARPGDVAPAPRPNMPGALSANAAKAAEDAIDTPAFPIVIASRAMTPNMEMNKPAHRTTPDGEGDGKLVTMAHAATDAVNVTLNAVDSLRDAGWGIQIGAFKMASTADRHINDAITTTGGKLSRALAAITPVERQNEVLYRARFGPMAEEDAISACDTLRDKGLACFAFTEQDWSTALRR